MKYRSRGSRHWLSFVFLIFLVALIICTDTALHDMHVRLKPHGVESGWVSDVRDEVLDGRSDRMIELVAVTRDGLDKRGHEAMLHIRYTVCCTLRYTVCCIYGIRYYVTFLTVR